MTGWTPDENDSDTTPTWNAPPTPMRRQAAAFDGAQDTTDDDEIMRGCLSLLAQDGFDAQRALVPPRVPSFDTDASDLDRAARRETTLRLPRAWAPRATVCPPAPWADTATRMRARSARRTSLAALTSLGVLALAASVCAIFTYGSVSRAPRVAHTEARVTSARSAGERPAPDFFEEPR